ncbi:MAG: hypothetical protein IPH08_11030 [Rhodocyclaceae bacterium]|nr:hypothetical protein [Rhodocyclaceae bacterium]
MRRRLKPKLDAENPGSKIGVSAGDGLLDVPIHEVGMPATACCHPPAGISTRRTALVVAPMVELASDLSPNAAAGGRESLQ